MIIKKKEPWLIFALKAILVLIIILVSLFYIHNRFSIGIDEQAVRCLDPYKIFIIDKHSDLPARNELYAFHAMDMEPYHKAGTVAVKQAVGVPGDTVKVTPTVTYINGKPVGSGASELAIKLNNKAEFYTKEYVLNDEEYFFMGWHPQSFDSRYWGVVHISQLVGSATPFKYSKD
jgi:conjugal transfer pilin signal peptidase TrbI